MLGYAWDLAPLTELLATSLLLTMLLQLVFTKLHLRRGSQGTKILHTILTFLLVIVILLNISRYRMNTGNDDTMQHGLIYFLKASHGPVEETTPPALLMEICP